jgi:hypothetical protein
MNLHVPTGSAALQPNARHVAGHRRMLLALLALPLLLAALLLAVAPQHADANPGHHGTDCVRDDLPVTLSGAPGATRYRVAGWLCLPRRHTSTVQLLVPGLTYTHRYWTGPGNGADYVTTALAAGDAVYLIDRIGTGASDRPPADQVTTTTEAAVTHQAIHALRDGTIGRFPHVVGIGHSFGSVIWMAEAATYHDVDALVLTGLLHDINPQALSLFTNDLYPAADDPKFASSGLPAGYLTTRPGSRAGYFLDPSTAVPGAAAWDEKTKTTATSGELTFTPDDELRYSRAVTAPVLLVVGATDALFCGPGQPCQHPADICQRERDAYATEVNLSAATVADTGHSINLHRSAPRAFNLIQRWLDRGVPSSGNIPAITSCHP